MKAYIWFFIGVCFFATSAFADTVRLKNGNAVEGKVISQTAESVKIDIGGTTLTYYPDEIASVDAGAVAAPAAAPVAPVSPEVAAPVPAVASPEVPVPAPVVAAPAVVAPAAAAPAVAAPVEVPAAAPAVVSQPPAPAPVVEAAPAQASGDELAGMNKEALINKFVEIYGVKENMQANFDQMTSTLKPDQAEAFRNAVKVDDIVHELLPIYDKHFSEEDLRTYIRFYGSAEGKKLIQTLPLLMKDSVEVSMKYLDVHLPESLKQSQPAENK